MYYMDINIAIYSRGIKRQAYKFKLHWILVSSYDWFLVLFLLYFSNKKWIILQFKQNLRVDYNYDEYIILSIDISVCYLFVCGV